MPGAMFVCSLVRSQATPQTEKMMHAANAAAIALELLNIVMGTISSMMWCGAQWLDVLRFLTNRCLRKQCSNQFSTTVSDSS